MINIVAYSLEVLIVIGSNAWLQSLGNEFLVTKSILGVPSGIPP